MRKIMILFSLLLLLFTIDFQTKVQAEGNNFNYRAPAATLTVGTNCTYADLQTAVNASVDGDTIRVEGKAFSGPSATVNIANGQAITIIGGYDNTCTNPTATPTTLDATGQADSVFELYGSSGSTGNFDQVVIRNFIITGGEDDGNFGGGIEINAGYEVRIESSEISGNTSTFGGGIHIDGDAKVTISDNTVVKGNTATDAGGGVYCNAADVVLTGNASLGDYFIVPMGNSATNTGGGFYGDGGCRFDAYSSVIGNDAANGGGVYLTGNSQLFMLFPESVVSSNEATTGDGGGVYLSGGAQITQHIGQIIYNSAANDGAGIYATGNSTQVIVNANTGAGNCTALAKCVQVSDNTANGNGGGIYLEGGASGDVAQAYFERNTANFGGAIYVFREAASLTTLDLSNVIFGRNIAQDRYILRYYSTDAAAVTLDFEGLTFAENVDNSGSVIEIGLRGNYTANMRGLIIWGADSQDAYFVEAAATATIADSLLPAGGSFPPGNLVGQDPLFIDAVNNNFHIRPDSPAVNLFAGGGLPEDIDGETRPARGSSLATGALRWDAGADEAAGRVSINGGLCNYATIGDAINAASNGDTLHISGGHYFELLDEVGKTLTLRAATADCTLALNTALDNVVQLRGSGGAADTTGGIVQIVGSNTVTFTNMSLYDANASFGGILYVDGAAKAVLQNSRLSDGSASNKGGCARALGTLELINSNINDCDATGSGDGAGVALNTGTLILRGNSGIGSGTLSRENIAADNGGGVYAQSGTIDLYDDSFINYNEATGNGGGVYLDHLSSLSLHDNSAIQSNQAVNGAGVYADGGNQEPRDTEINVTDNATIGGATVAEQNVASGIGGGVYLQGGAWLKLSGSGMIYNNHATAQGGGVALLDGGWMTITGASSEVRENSAAGDGGGVYLSGNGSNLTLSGGTIMNNTTATNGGGVALYNNATAAITAPIAGNEATLAGGGLFNASTLSITATAIISNSADHGGGIANESVLSLLNTTLANNQATGNGAGSGGGGIYQTGGAADAEVLFSTFSDNGAPNVTGRDGVWLSGGTLGIGATILNDSSNCTISGGTLNGLGYNFDVTSTCALLAGSGSTHGVDPLLLPLGDNGGSSLTYALDMDSLAINAIPNSGSGLTLPATDQRGQLRNDGQGDSGAYESAATTYQLYLPTILNGG